MILVDSSVWIDYFRGTNSVAAESLDQLLQAEPVAIGDLILAEVLQGFTSERDFAEARKLLTALEVVTLGGNVSTWSQRRAAERTAWSAPGVSSVVDELTIS